MAAYCGAGIEYETARRFTLGELRAIYRGDHRGPTGATPPMSCTAEEADTRAATDIKELREPYQAAQEENGNDVRPDKPCITSGAVVPIATRVTHTGLEGLREYVKKGIAV
jgi:hypothetical protein